MATAKTAMALFALIVPSFLMGISCCGLVADAFYPPTPSRSNFLSREAAHIPSLVSKETIRAATILELQAGDENQSLPTESSTVLKKDETNYKGKIDELVSALNEKLEQVEGMWYSDDFYGLHGREWVKVSATLVGSGTSAIVAVKITGDANVPSGCVTWKTLGWPALGGSDVPAEVQVRADPGDPNGFSWVAGRLVLVSRDQIVLSARFSPSFEASGTFHRLNREEES
mmetsp:Transcript_26839/g.53588  ORF Transcript_26839/g.53588 Transcript_26839/m.53588 type:complete len:229 (-) Transcript_26839:114-800(-)|eukprot:CAMPEP_0194329870 /NCGR_PEP_ID=MMETSP0171-20130528/49510_1 /TAXON_ID=218684 /ORGANISM="Corethron pennatum, Strain L29A3" /LENGTH=228 /DNA_ID=CAMNT_0039090719 /DNA_START=245 /DNA_END=931 /DNA_ORIENTATION=+